MQDQQQINDAINAAVAGPVAPEAVEAAKPEPAAGPAAPAAAAGPAKKKPGRPKKHPQMPPIETHGIVQKPVNEGDFLEMVYCNPILFKKIFNLFKSFNVSEIDLIFDQNGLKMVMQDFLKKSSIYATIDGRCMNLYYCKEQIRIRVKRDNMQKVLSTLGKNHHKITFVLKEDYRSKLYVNTRDTRYGVSDTWEIEVVYGANNKEAIVADDDTNYPLKFHFDAKFLKERVNNINSLSKNVIVQIVGSDPLQFTYDKNHSVNLSGVHTENDKLGLVSRLDAGECLSVSICIDYIKPFTNSTIGEEVYIAVDKRAPISFMTQLDKGDFGWAATIKIFTEINKARPRAENAAGE
jgi:hypothetical protein